MKRFICIMLVVVTVFACTTPVLAATEEPPITPRYSYIEGIQSSLSIDETTGLAMCHSSTYAIGGSSIKLTCTLQRKNGSSWSTVYSWSKTASQNAVINRSYGVYSGYTYRVKAVCSVYNSSGRVVETGTVYSSQVTYN